MIDFKKSKQLMEGSDSIAIFTHANADGDAIGSAFALYYYLKDLGKNVDVFSDTILLPSQLEFLGVEKILNKSTQPKYDLAIITDCNNLDLLGKNKQQLLKINKSVQFDHHPLNPNLASVNNVITEISSASELVAMFFLDQNINITSKIGTFLLSGIITDSGGFRFSCVSGNTMRIVADIIDKSNINLSQVMNHLFESESMDSYKMQKEAYNNTEFLADGKIVIVKLDYNFYKNSKVNPNACKFLTRIGTELKDTCLVAVISEVEPNVNKVSFRSRKGYDASRCARVFGGGGHVEASGCKIHGNFYDTVEQIKQVLMDELI